MIYVVQQSGRPFVKIGFTARPVAERIREFNTGSVERMLLLFVMDGSQAAERRLHRQFRVYRVRRDAEWFRLEGDLLDWVQVEKLRSDEERAAEREERRRRRQIQREAEACSQRFQSEARERARAEERWRRLSCAVAYGRYITRQRVFGDWLARQYLPRLLAEAQALHQRFGFSTHLPDTASDRLHECRAAWNSEKLPEDVLEFAWNRSYRAMIPALAVWALLHAATGGIALGIYLAFGGILVVRSRVRDRFSIRVANAAPNKPQQPTGAQSGARG